jgi:hypothetical protein
MPTVARPGFPEAGEATASHPNGTMIIDPLFRILG